MVISLSIRFKESAKKKNSQAFYGGGGGGGGSSVWMGEWWCLGRVRERLGKNGLIGGNWVN